MSLSLELDGWVDGERVRTTVHPPPLDRWQLHAADEARVTVRAHQAGGAGSGGGGGGGQTASAPDAAAGGAAVSVVVRQKPQSIPASRMGVGAVFWEGELALACFLAAQPRHRWQGATVVELGAGPGLAGLVAARLMSGRGGGAGRVVITDLPKVVPLIRENVALNGFGDGGGGGGGGSAGVEVLAAELEWGREGYLGEAAAVARLANGGREGGGGGGGGGSSGGGTGGGGGGKSGKNTSNNSSSSSAGSGNNAGGVDWVIAADVTYVDGDGESPSTEHFVRACHALSGARTRVVVALEVRAGGVRDDLRRHGALLFERGGQVKGDALPKGFCREAGEHLEVYEFGGPRRLG